MTEPTDVIPGAVPLTWEELVRVFELAWEELIYVDQQGLWLEVAATPPDGRRYAERTIAVPADGGRHPLRKLEDGLEFLPRLKDSIWRSLAAEMGLSMGDPNNRTTAVLTALARAPARAFQPVWSEAAVAALGTDILAMGWAGSIIQWDGYGGTTYQCGTCYWKTLAAAAPSCPMSIPPRTPPPPGTRCCSCGRALE